MQIVVEPNGDMQFTRKPHLMQITKGMGRKSIDRMTDIIFDETYQQFYIHFLTGPFANLDLTVQWTLNALASDKSAFWYFITEYQPRARESLVLHQDTLRVMFTTYEAAVDFEVEFVEFLRVLGYDMRT